MHWISVIIGLVVAWAIIFFIGPKPYVVSYYEPEADEPVVGVAMSELDAMMMAVGLISESTIDEELSMAPSPAPAPAPMMESVADMAMMDTDLSMAMMDNEFSMSPAPSPMEISESTEDLSGQDTGAIPPPF